MITTAVIMAAGLGTRFGDMTQTMPKGFIEIGGMSMIERSVKTLISCGIERIIIGTGYHKEAYESLAKRYPEIKCVFSPLYAETNSLYTLYNCRESISNDDFLLLESDLVFNKSAIEVLLQDTHPDVMLITPVTKFQDQYYVEYNDKGTLSRCSTIKDEIDAKGELVGIHKLSSAFYHKLCKDYEGKLNDYLKLGYEYELLYMSNHISPVYVLNSEKVKWYEIDDEQDLKYAEDYIIKNIY